MEFITPCETNTPETTPPFRQLNFSGRKKTRSTSKQEEKTGGASSRISSQVPTSLKCHSSSPFKMVGQDPTIRLPEFKGEASEDPEKNFLIREKTWEENQIIDEDTKLAQLAITLRDRALDW